MSGDTFLEGRLTGDPELKYLPSGIALASFSIATSKRVLNKNTNEWEDRDTTFWNCSAFDKLAEQVCEYLTKGMAVLAKGEAYTRAWEDKQGQKRTSVEYRVRCIGEDIRWRKTRTESRQRPPQDDEPPF